MKLLFLRFALLGFFVALGYGQVVGRGVAPPSSCQPGDVFVKTTAAAAQQLYVCVGAEWTAQGGGGGGVSVNRFQWPGAICQGGGAGTPYAFATGGSAVVPIATCPSFTNTVAGVLEFNSTGGQYVQHSFVLPSSMSAVSFHVYWRTPASSGSITWSLQVGCASATSYDVTWNTAQTMVIAATTANYPRHSSMTLSAGTLTGCAADSELFFRFGTSATTLGDVAQVVRTMFEVTP